MSTKKEKAVEKAVKAKVKADKKAAKEKVVADKKAAKLAEKAAKKVAKNAPKEEVSDVPEENKPPLGSKPDLSDNTTLRTGVIFEGATVTAILSYGETPTAFHCSMSDGTTKHVPKSLFS